jgi:tetratricopeptide (TPR) repeat protein
MGKKYEYEIVLSFAGEQRKYVEETSKYLKELGIKYFYDYDEQIDLWGKNLTQHLDKIYSEKSLYFIPFISKEYVKKRWTNLELSSALERNMKDKRQDFQQYILPVKFDDTRAPGIPSTIGIIDAKKISPKDLADIIFEKVRGYSPKKKSRDNDQDTLIISENYNEKINLNKLKELEIVYTGLKTSYIVNVYGEKGLGKKTCIQHFLENKKNVIKIISAYESQYHFSSIVQAFNLDISYAGYSQDLSFREQIKKEIILYCKEQPTIIYVERLDEFDAETTCFLLELASSLLHYLNFKTLIIFEFDTDKNQDLEKQFFQFPPNYITPIQFNKLLSENLKEYFFQQVGSISISERSLCYILESSFGNILYLNIIINYLRSEGLIYYDADKMICKELKEGTLSNVLKDYILQRYNRLDDTLKEVLSKSSIIGNTFSSKLLFKPFEVINADELLRNVEKISRLITQPYDNTYAFENLDVYRMIKENVNPQMQREWHQMLAEYYEALLKRYRYRNKNNVTEEIKYVYSIAKHFKYANNNDAALSYYLELLPKYEYISDYLHMLEIIKDINDILDNAEMNEKYHNKLEYTITRSEAVCHKEMGNFRQAYDLFCECIDDIDQMALEVDKFDLIFNQAYCLYNDGDTEGALNVLDTLKKEFEQKKIYNTQYFKILSALASVYDSIGQKVEEKKYFIEALNYYKENQCTKEYYSLLRKASMIFGEELAINMYEEAEKYFRKESSIRYLAEVLHNKATDLMYIGKTIDALPALKESIDLFSSYGSQSIHYPLNTKGILKMLLGEYQNAIEVFKEALKYNMETFSKITLRTNILNCLNIIGKFEEAMKELEKVDLLIQLPESQSTPVYAIYHHLNWAFYYYHTQNFDGALKEIKMCEKLTYMEPRYKYVYKSLKYYVKKALNINSRNTAGTPPNNIFRSCVEKQFYFTTIRFYE